MFVLQNAACDERCPWMAGKVVNVHPFEDMYTTTGVERQKHVCQFDAALGQQLQASRGQN